MASAMPLSRQPYVAALQAAEKVLMFVTVFEVAMFYKRSMRGDDKQQAAMFSYVTLEQRIPADH
ncbi:MAG: hypothetical protein P4K78_10825, partial [Terracidiphilus sp.]|nr:hypothetical protein [Terracidiphilus sp.]